MRGHVFIKNTLILTATSFILRTVGIVFRVFLAGKIGAEGVGLYQMIFSVYILASTFASSGICTAVTRMVAEQGGERKSSAHILRRALICTLPVAAVSCLVVYFGAGAIATHFIRDVRAVPALKILCFSLPFMGVSSCLRGYFIARRQTLSPSVAQLAEQAVRIGVILFLLYRFAPLGVGAAAAAVLLGDTLAEAAGCLYLGISYLFARQKAPKTQNRLHSTVKRILHIALPISGSKYLTTALHTAENLLVPAGLAKYAASQSQGVALFGKLKGMAIPLLFFPASFLSAMSTLLIPEISAAMAAGHTERMQAAVRRAFGVTSILSVCIGGVFVVCAPQLGQLVYADGQVGDIIRILAPIVPFMYLESIADGMLKGLNQQVSSLKYNCIDMSIRIVLVLVLVPKTGMYGFLGIMVASNILTSTLNCRRLLKIAGVRLPWADWVLKPLLGTLVGGVLGNGFATLLAPGSALGYVLVEGALHIAVFFAVQYVLGAKEKIFLKNGVKT